MNKIKVKGGYHPDMGYTDWQFTCADHFNAWTVADTWAEVYEAAVGHACMHHPKVYRFTYQWSDATIARLRTELSGTSNGSALTGRGKW